MTGDQSVVRNAFVVSGLGFDDFWIRYVGLGGILTPSGLHTYIEDGGDVPDGQYNVIVHTLNERFVEIDLDHPVPYDPA